MAARTQSQRSTATQSRPGLGSTFSFSSKSSKRSDKSWKLKEPKPTIDNLIETARDKKRLTSKADPTLAMNEMEPAAIAAVGPSVNYESIRLMQHRDLYGNVIADPDRSNPTRSRWERPLDTIRAFEAAIDDRYKRTSVLPRPDSSDTLSAFGGRRQSYISDQNRRRPQSRYQQQHEGNYYDNGQSTPRADTYQQNSVPPNSYFNPNRVRFNQRMQTEPTIQQEHGYHQNNVNGNTQHYGHATSNGQGVYPSPVYRNSHDTVASTGSASGSGSGSHGTEYWGNSTDPSSENSSVDRITPVQMKPPPPPAHDTYSYPTQQMHAGFNDNGGNGIYQPPQLSFNKQSVQSFQNQPQNDRIHAPVVAAPPVPPKGPPQIQRKPIRLNSKLSHAESYANERTAGPDKRKSWFKRFSRGAQ
ncbi:MAG: hypothetical protein M1814_000647 [Vezdaea aestivalis]|nr:MAG: hypothetical protein M1814_000647 [Vezdaea aestivalis]